MPRLKRERKKNGEREGGETVEREKRKDKEMGWRESEGRMEREGLCIERLS